MTRVHAPFLTGRPGAKGTTRWFFQPPTRYLPQGWAAVRLHDEWDQPIQDELEAAKACRALKEIFDRWRAGEEGYGPHMIDRLGRIVQAKPAKTTRRQKRDEVLKASYRPGQIGAMVFDFLRHDLFKKEKSAKTQSDYRSYLGKFVETFGTTYWHKLAPGPVRDWLLVHADEEGPSGAHACYRTCRAFFGQVRLIYPSVDHPGFVPDYQNPMRKMKLTLPTGQMMIWPRAAVEAFVALADAEGEPSIGDAIVIMSWLGPRKQDWLSWPADTFDRDLVAFRQQKTSAPNVLPWRMVPALVERIDEARRRRQGGQRPADAAVSLRFFHDKQGLPWKDADAFRDAFNALRDKLAVKHPTWPTRYYAGLVDGDPLALPTNRLTMRTLRHTCVTLNFDAGVPSNLIGGITGHSQVEIDDILAHYRANTADQAAAALQMRLEHEAKGKGARA
jgi:integrase